MTPRARSSGRSSSSHAQAKEPLPAALASLSALWAAFWLTCLRTQGVHFDVWRSSFGARPHIIRNTPSHQPIITAIVVLRII